MANDNYRIGKILLDEKQIQERAAEIGKQITEDFAGESVVVLCTLKGSLPWTAEVIKNIELDMVLDFIRASSYGSSTTSSGVVKISIEPKENLYNKNVIIMEDIIDTGNTLSYLIKKLEERGPKSVTLCTMLNKQARRVNDIKSDYIGFEVDDLFVIGYGLDYDEKYRNLPYVSYLEEDDIEKL